MSPVLGGQHVEPGIGQRLAEDGGSHQIVVDFAELDDFEEVLCRSSVRVVMAGDVSGLLTASSKASPYMVKAIKRRVTCLEAFIISSTKARLGFCAIAFFGRSSSQLLICFEKRGTMFVLA